MREKKKLNRVKYAQYYNKLKFQDQTISMRTFSLNNEAQNRRQAFFQLILGCHISNFFLPEDCAELITDPLKVFDSFSVFVEPISYQRIFHLVSVFYITAHLVNIILEMQLTLISAQRATDCCRSPLLVAFEIPGVGFHRLRS